jgi:DNA-directed RNA polymerase subunit RPC12/RpoP
MLPLLARLRMVMRDTFSMPASSSAFKARRMLANGSTPLDRSRNGGQGRAGIGHKGLLNRRLKLLLMRGLVLQTQNHLLRCSSKGVSPWVSRFLMPAPQMFQFRCMYCGFSASLREIIQRRGRLECPECGKSYEYKSV